MQAAIYVRVSTWTIGNRRNQLRGVDGALQKEAAELGFTASDSIIYKEEGVSGEEIDCPEMNGHHSGDQWTRP